MQPRNRHGFTLVELLVVIAIIGILIALLLPAVQAAREAARRSQCSNNLKQVGLGLHNYHDTFKCFPPGAMGANTAVGPGGSRVSGWVFILPFIEESAAYDLWDFQYGYDNSQNNVAKKTPIDTFFCPSRARSEMASSSIAYGDYALSAGTGHCNTSDKFYLKGIFNQYSGCRFRDITDGTSNTIAAGEKRTEQASLTSPQYRWGWHAIRTMNYPMNRDVVSDAAFSVLLSGGTTLAGTSAGWNDYWANFGGPHAGGAQFALADGSVTFVSETIEFDTYQYLGDKSDGQVH